jgi:hypothetical protein
MSLREDFARNIVAVLKDMQDPKPALVTREPFDVEKIAITQFPAILITTGSEVRQDISMQISRQGFISYEIRAFVRGTELDTKINDIVERIEETLDQDRRRDTGTASMLTRVSSIQRVTRLAPLAEVIVNVDVRYKYQKGTT